MFTDKIAIVTGAGRGIGKEIAKIMGVEAGKETKKVAFVACQGTCDKAKTDYEYHGIADCAMLSFVPNGGNPVIMVVPVSVTA